VISIESNMNSIQSFILIPAVTILGLASILAYNDGYKYKLTVDQTSYISGYVTTLCKNLNTTECKDLIIWGQQIINKLIK